MSTGMAEFKTDSSYATDYFKLNRLILRIGGLWSPNFNSMPSRVLYHTYSLYIYFFVHIYFTITEFASMTETYVQLTHLIKNMSMALTHLMGAVKVTFWFLRGQELRNLMIEVEAREFQYECFGDFQPGLITRKAKTRGKIYTLAFITMAHMIGSSSYLPALVNALLNPQYVQDDNGETTFQHSLPYFTWIPFEYNKTRTRYLLALLYQFVPMYLYVYSICGMDTLFMGLMNMIQAHLEVLKGAFKTIRARSVAKLKHQGGNVELRDGLYDSNLLEKEMSLQMKKCIRHLQKIIGVCDELENIHKFLTLGQVLATLFIFCTCLFLVSTTPLTNNSFSNEIVYMIAMCFQLVLYCWFGHGVTKKASEIPMAIWESDWLSSNRSYRTSMVITMTRMQRPLHLTVGKFAPLTLETFVAILRVSYSFFAVLKQVNE